MKLCICGPGRCGKDTVTNWLDENTNLKKAPSTSWIISQEIAKIQGTSVEKAHENRIESREYWYDVGRELCINDPSFLVKECLKQGNIIQGIRDNKEFLYSRRFFDLIIWIERASCYDEDGNFYDTTMKFNKEYCDITIENNGPIILLYDKLERLTKAFNLL